MRHGGNLMDTRPTLVGNNSRSVDKTHVLDIGGTVDQLQWLGTESIFVCQHAVMLRDGGENLLD